MQECIDQMGREILVPISPKRIVSLVPSISDLLCYLDLEEYLVGVTSYCISPESLLKNKTIIGGTKKFDLEAIEQLNPDLIIGDKEENYEAGIEYLSGKIPVWMCDFNTIAGSLNMIGELGQITNRKKESQKLIREILNGMSQLQKVSAKSVAYFIWRKPFMVAASQTYINDVLETLGLTNAFGKESRYPVVNMEAIASAHPDIIFLSSEPYPFSGKHIQELANLCPNAYVILVDGASFSWSGPRFLHAMDYFSDLVAQISR